MSAFEQICRRQSNKFSKIKTTKADNLTCPVCNWNEAYAKVFEDKSIVIGCNRKNNCELGKKERHAFHFFKDLFPKKVSSESNPQHVEKRKEHVIKMLKKKGLKGKFYPNMEPTFCKYFKGPNDFALIPACRFLLDNSQTNKPSYNARHEDFYDLRTGKTLKAKNYGQTSKGVWSPNFDFDFEKPVWLFEAPYKGISAYENNVSKNCLCLTSSSQKKPAELEWILRNIDLIKEKKTKFVLALDNDNAGLECMKSWASWLMFQNLKFAVCLLPENKDFNDLEITKDLIKESFLRGKKFIGSLDLSQKKIDVAQAKDHFVEYTKPAEVLKKIKEYNTDLPPDTTISLLAEKMQEAFPQFPRHSCIYGAISVSTHCFQHLACTGLSGSLSQLGLIVGPPGSGKTTLLTAIQEIVSKVNPKGQMPWVTGATALGQQMSAQENYCGTMYPDELLSPLYKWHNSANVDNVLSMLLSILTISPFSSFQAQRSARKIDKGTGNREDQGDYEFETLISPALSILGSGTDDDWIRKSSDAGFMNKGVGSRMEVIEFGNWIKVPILEKRFSLYSKNKQGFDILKEPIAKLQEVFNLLNLSHNHTNRMKIRFSEKAIELLDDFDSKCGQDINKNQPGDFSPTRLVELVSKTVSRIGVANSYLQNQEMFYEVQEDLMRWAIKYISNQYELFKESTEKELDLESIFIKKVLQRLKNGPMSAEKIRSNIKPRIDLRSRKQILDYLCQTQQITFSDKKYYLL